MLIYCTAGGRYLGAELNNIWFVYSLRVKLGRLLDGVQVEGAITWYSTRLHVPLSAATEAGTNVCRSCQDYAFRCGLCDQAVRGLFTVCRYVFCSSSSSKESSDLYFIFLQLRTWRAWVTLKLWFITIGSVVGMWITAFVFRVIPQRVQTPLPVQV
jgi:hypothetical protein